MSAPLPKGWVVEMLMSNPPKYRAASVWGVGPIRETHEEAKTDASRLDAEGLADALRDVAADLGVWSSMPDVPESIRRALQRRAENVRAVLLSRGLEP